LGTTAFVSTVGGVDRTGDQSASGGVLAQGHAGVADPVLKAHLDAGQARRNTETVHFLGAVGLGLAGPADRGEGRDRGGGLVVDRYLALAGQGVVYCAGADGAAVGRGLPFADHRQVVDAGGDGGGAAGGLVFIEVLDSVLLAQAAAEVARTVRVVRRRRNIRQTSLTEQQQRLTQGRVEFYRPAGCPGRDGDSVVGSFPRDKTAAADAAAIEGTQVGHLDRPGGAEAVAADADTPALQAVAHGVRAADSDVVGARFQRIAHAHHQVLVLVGNRGIGVVGAAGPVGTALPLHAGGPVGIVDRGKSGAESCRELVATNYHTRGAAGDLQAQIPTEEV